MSKQTTELTNLDPRIKQFQSDIRAKFAVENKSIKKGQIVFVGSSLMEIFPIEKMQKEKKLGLEKIIYNRGIRATTTADLLAHIDLQIFDLKPSKIFINIGSNDIGFNVPENTYLSNYDEIFRQIKEKLPNTEVYALAYYPMNAVYNFGEEKHEHASMFATRSNDDFAKMSEKVAALAQKHNYQFINVNANLADENGNLRPELTFDGVHMLPAGYEIVLKNLMKYL
ncbi:GDSL-type esterase/lipase family protein [Loigolactobacillus zhaoyuanensis]|uniref:GDSL-type esterase/lipase family protein n=1 Tax=Loigolactobacillus zhaoyuanensis TaxID=2486017 RepID=A0ABW8U8R9_9LACO|nr:GDSL-type esterase/lipase family protein [Loigolactobacillus zhaoyuanensis]